MTAEQWTIAHLHDPRNEKLQLGKQGEEIDMSWSNCPSQLQMFEEKDLVGQGDNLAINLNTEAMTQVVPREQARVLTDYLLTLKRDSALPESMSNAPKKTDAATKK